MAAVAEASTSPTTTAEGHSSLAQTVLDAVDRTTAVDCSSAAVVAVLHMIGNRAQAVVARLVSSTASAVVLRSLAARHSDLADNSHAKALAAACVATVRHDSMDDRRSDKAFVAVALHVVIVFLCIKRLRYVPSVSTNLYCSSHEGVCAFVWHHCRLLSALCTGAPFRRR